MAEGFTIWELGPVLFCGERREMWCLLKCRMEKAGGEIFPFAHCHLKALIQGQRADREESGLHPWDGKREHQTKLSHHHQQQQQNMVSTGRGKGEAWRNFGGIKAGLEESKCFSHVWASPDSLCAPNSHALSRDLGRAFPLLWRREQEGLVRVKNGQRQPAEENLANSKKWPHEQG